MFLEVLIKIFFPFNWDITSALFSNPKLRSFRISRFFFQVNFLIKSFRKVILITRMLFHIVICVYSWMLAYTYIQRQSTAPARRGVSNYSRSFALKILYLKLSSSTPHYSACPIWQGFPRGFLPSSYSVRTAFVWLLLSLRMCLKV